MAHLGILCPNLAGHFNPMCALGRALMRRGHRVTVFQIPEGEARARAAGLDFVPIGAADYPPGRFVERLAGLGHLQGLAALRYTIGLLREWAEMVLRDAPGALRGSGVDGLVLDQASYEARTLSESAGLRFATVANALLLNTEPGVPPFTTHWPYREAAWARLRNRVAADLTWRLVRPLTRAIQEHRRKLGLPRLGGRRDWYSDLAQVGQLPVEFDFPRAELPPHFHYCGPFHEAEARAPVPFPFEKLDGRPLIYASMGTLQNRLVHVFEAIAGACEGQGAQLVISLGGSADPASLPPLPGSPTVVRYAPQLDLVARARLVITHAGMNTVMETLAHGTPMVAVPVANDQPGVASRLAHAGAGEVVPLRKLTADRLRPAVHRVLSDPSYAEKARGLQAAIRRAGGADRAAEIVERALGTGRPVLADHGGRPNAPHASGFAAGRVTR